jgi:hypothetical protein
VSPFVFLLIPVVVVLVASLYVYVRGRQPTGLHSGIDGFQREMNAISPDAAQRRQRRFDTGPPTRPVRPVGPARPSPPPPSDRRPGAGTSSTRRRGD